jgi:hypothetical protein
MEYCRKNDKYKYDDLGEAKPGKLFETWEQGCLEIYKRPHFFQMVHYRGKCFCLTKRYRVLKEVKSIYSFIIFPRYEGFRCRQIKITQHCCIFLLVCCRVERNENPRHGSAELRIQGLSIYTIILLLDLLLSRIPGSHSIDDEDFYLPRYNAM